MPIKIPDALPATAILESENIFVMTEYRALHQDIRPLKVLILNLMPTKIVTETQILRKLSNTPVQIQVELLRTASYQSQHTDEDHLASFYTTFDQVRDRNFDGMIITGAPVENLEFNQVDYWPELCEIMAWSRTHVHSTLHICWGAQAALHYHYGLQKTQLPQKLFGVFQHTLVDKSVPLLRGFDEVYWMPHSRHTEISAEQIRSTGKLYILSTSPEAGVNIISNHNGRQIFIFGHSEYEAGTLAEEYFRDLDKGLPIQLPCNYFPQDDPTQKPIRIWRSHAYLFYSNWLNYYVYQSTPYDLGKLRLDPLL